ncbi:MAG: hypothetical protein ACPGNT_04180 [Rhodospirillales bacterium]
MRRFTANLARLDGEGVATVRVVATLLRINLERHDVVPAGLFGLTASARLDPGGAHLDTLARLNRAFLGRDNPSDTAASFVWLHTLRALFYPELRAEGQALWGELVRGNDHLAAALGDAEALRGEPFDPAVIDGVTFVPEGLAR